MLDLPHIYPVNMRLYSLSSGEFAIKKTSQVFVKWKQVNLILVLLLKRLLKICFEL